MAIINFKNQGLKRRVREGTELLQLYKQDPTLPLKLGCCNGQCGVCRIKMINGNEHLSKPTKQEKETLMAKELTDPPYRLACQCAILGDVTIEC